MNCQRFENVVSELAREQMMAAEQRGEALAHSETCEKCAARLRDEEMLTRGVQMARASEVKATTSVKRAVESTPDTILDTAAAMGCGLIVIGTHGHGGVRRAVLGSVADRVSRHSPVPVMLVPPSTVPAAAD